LGALEFSREGFEVIVAGQDNDHELCQKIESGRGDRNYTLNYITVAGSNRSAQLNEAILQANGRILVFTDDDCIFPRDWLEKLAQVFEREANIGVVGGKDRTGTDEPSLNVALDYVLHSFLGTGGLRRKGSLIGKYYPKLWNMAIPREVALGVACRSGAGKLQVFDETLDVHEDVEITDRIEKSGKRIIYAPGVEVLHARDTTLRSFATRSFNMARTSRSVGVHRLPHILLATFTLGLLALAFASFISRSIGTLFAAVCSAYLIILLISGFGAYIRTGRAALFFYVPVLLTVQHFSRGLGYLFPWRGRIT